MRHEWALRWLEMCEEVAKWSPCPRGKVGAFIIKNNQPLSQGFNGPPRGPYKLCGGDECSRDCMGIPSGQRVEVGCHHAEANAITHASREGISINGASIVINCEPCLACAKLIHHSGLSEVVIGSRGYSRAGLEYLSEMGIEITLIHLG